ncbi:MAG: hypothetical protein ACRDU4_06830 [Mycobacterium sp.]
MRPAAPARGYELPRYEFPVRSVSSLTWKWMALLGLFAASALMGAVELTLFGRSLPTFAIGLVCLLAAGGLSLPIASWAYQRIWLQGGVLTHRTLWRTTTLDLATASVLLRAQPAGQVLLDARDRAAQRTIHVPLRHRQALTVYAGPFVAPMHLHALAVAIGTPESRPPDERQGVAAVTAELYGIAATARY